MSISTPHHIHVTRDIKPRGMCPACDGYWVTQKALSDDRPATGAEMMAQIVDIAAAIKADKEAHPERYELLDVMRRHISWDLATEEPMRQLADAILAAGYRKVDHAEYALDHKLSDLQFTDDDGELWTDEDDFREYAEEYGDGMRMVQRNVTAWEPVR